MNDLRKAAEMALEDICGAKLCEVNSMSSRAEMLRLMDKAAEALRQALAQSEKEPVAWADKVGAVIPHSHKLFQPDLLKDYTVPLYTAPPKREWVGLTDEDLVDCESEEDVQFVKRIEAKLKEKNGG